jgi:hypothetical protein
VNPRSLLIWLLRLTGTVEITAFFAVVMPPDWMAAAHTWLGLGDMPDGPVFSFVIRQASFIYGIHGVLLWIVVSDVARYLPIVIYTGIGYVVAGPVFFLIDWMSGTPWLWTIFDSVSCFALGMVILELVKWSRLYDERAIGHNEGRYADRP